MSLRASMSLPCACSGDIYATVPSTCPRTVMQVGDRGRIGGRAASHTQLLGQAKIQQLGITAARHKNIGGFEIAMNDASLVRRVESV